jgi:hypothetical protein
VSKTLEHLLGVHAAFDELDGDLLAKLTVGALRQINRTHAAAPQLFDEAINADLAIDVFINDRIVCRFRFQQTQNSGFKKSLGIFIMCQHRIYMFEQFGVVAAGAPDKIAAFLRGKDKRGIKYLFDLFPAFR